MSGSPPLLAGPGAAADPYAPGAPGVPACLPAAYGTQSDAPLGATPAAVRAWFDAALNSAIPDADGTLATAQQTAKILARHAKADNTRRAYRAGVRAWCAWCGRTWPDPAARPAGRHRRLPRRRTLPPRRGKAARRQHTAAQGRRDRLPALPRRLPLPHLHGDGHRDLRWARPAGQAGRPGSRPKLAAKIGILREILAPIVDDLPGLRDRALLLLGFAGAFRRAELARIAVGDLEAAEHGLRITLPLSKGDRESKGVQVGIPYGASDALPGARAAALARRRRHHPGTAVPPHLGDAAAKDAPRELETDPRGRPDGRRSGTIARIVKARGKVAGFDARALGGHSLKRGAMNTAKDRRVHPAQLKQLGRHRSYATLAAYIEEGDLFEDNALNGVL